jgi:hypothetical protein
MQSGQLAWQFKTGGPVESSPVYASGNNMVYVGSDDGFVYALNVTATSATQAWTKFPGGSVYSSPALAPDGTLWYGSTTGVVQHIGPLPAISTPAIPPTRTPGPTATATATPSVTATATATATATTLPQLPLSVTVSKKSIKPGQKQTVTVTTSPNTKVHFRVEYPNGDHQSSSKTSNASGKATYSYTQGASKIMHTKFTAKVIVKVGSGTSKNQVTATYKIKFATIDVSAEPRTVAVGKTAGIYVHAAVGSRVTAFVIGSSGKRLTFRGHTGPKGFAHFSFKVPSGMTRGSNHKVTLMALLDSRPNVQAKTTFTIK